MTIMKNKLVEKVGENFVIEDCDMKGFTSFRAGGKADLLVMPQNEEQLAETLAVLAAADVEYMVMGNGSNILVRDGGYRGVIVKLGEAFSSVRTEEGRLIAGCGTLMSSAARAALEASLTGFEFASGIPGSLGGAVFMNAGAYGGEMADIIKEVKLLKRDGSRSYTRSCEEMGLGYRRSVLHETGDVAVEVVLQLAKGDKDEIRAQMKELAAKRNAKQPVSLPSAGSFFKRPQGYFAGKLIQDAGLKGLSVGDAQVSPLHSGFIVNNGTAAAKDITRLMEIVQAAVLDKFGVKLEPEVRIIGED